MKKMLLLLVLLVLLVIASSCSTLEIASRETNDIVIDIMQIESISNENLILENIPVLMIREEGEVSLRQQMDMATILISFVNRNIDIVENVDYEARQFVEGIKKYTIVYVPVRSFLPGKGELFFSLIGEKSDEVIDFSGEEKIYQTLKVAIENL